MDVSVLMPAIQALASLMNTSNGCQCQCGCCDDMRDQHQQLLQYLLMVDGSFDTDTSGYSATRAGR